MCARSGRNVPVSASHGGTALPASELTFKERERLQGEKQGSVSLRSCST